MGELSVGWIYLLFFIIALIYSSVGLGGGSAYTALFALLNIDPVFIPSSSMFLNVVVTLISFFINRKFFNYSRLKIVILIYIIGGIGVLIGTEIKLKVSFFYIFLGSFLILSSLFSIGGFFFERLKIRIPFKIVPIIVLLIGVVSGISGLGGGVFLSPILLFSNFPIREIPAITSFFIFVNSTTGFIKYVFNGKVNYNLILPLALVVGVGSVIGSYIGANIFTPKILRIVLSLIIAVIGVQIILRGIFL